MSRDVTIKILQHHIDEGKPGVMGECPIALAVKEALPGYDVCVSYHSISVMAPEGTLAAFAMHPGEIRRFVEAFDDYGLRGMPRDHFRPFTATLTMPDGPVTGDTPWRLDAIGSCS